MKQINKAAGIATMTLIIVASYCWVMWQFVLFKFDIVNLPW